MKSANMLSLADKVIRPDIDKHLVPIMLYKGTRSFGWMHRRWNFAILCMESEIENYTQAVKLSHNPDYAHLCGPRKGMPYGTFPSLFGRLRDHPQVTDNISGLTAYVKELERQKLSFYRLTPVDLYTNDPTRKDGRYASWRIHDYSPEVKAEREKLRQEKISRKLGRLLGESIEREFNRDLAHVARVARREARSREQMANALRQEPRQQLFYPYLVHNPRDDDQSTRLLLRVHDAVPKNLPADIRADLCQDLLVAILSGDMEESELEESELEESVKSYLPKVRDMHPFKYGNISLDDMISEDDDRDRHSIIVPPGYDRLEY